MRFLAKTALLRPKPVHFPDGRYLVFIPNFVFTLDDGQAAFLKDEEPELFRNLLKLRDRPVAKVETPAPSELEQLLKDEPELEESTLVEVELVVGEEPPADEPKKPRRRSKKAKKEDK